ncbi:purine-nucleoside phosphorylase [Campylobacter sp. IFREMER_LSEM_CL292]|uniref:purine-nucleoside phosphorylase n=1 Tax=Campylobacter sp. IFREMER_LSEM_CL292 TaxID=2911623 RepID=UPI0021E7B4C0|nr:purine-nucleoside phosphorylase [Campylobacter sp. IFREMER_LSEM_CL292]MCV3382638.1 purine-nucleoside phosphorylase [Campylobacter sp. IFREMER_LSEM_CL292]
MKNLIVCAGGNEDFKFAQSIGVGLVNSAFSLGKILSQVKVDRVIFIGTCGIYQEGKILDIYESSNAANLEYADLFDSFYTPIANEIRLNVSHETMINSSNYICKDENIAQEFFKKGVHIENMEAYAVLSCAKMQEIEGICYLCATNFCNEFAHEDFLKNHQEAKELLKDFLLDKKLI